jgi:hypothetical protein
LSCGTWSPGISAPARFYQSPAQTRGIQNLDNRRRAKLRIPRPEFHDRRLPLAARFHRRQTPASGFQPRAQPLLEFRFDGHP